MRLYVQGRDKVLIFMQKTPKAIHHILVCTVKEVDVAKGFNELFLLNPNSDIIYPGSIMKARSVEDGSYTPVVAPRKPMNISVSLPGMKPSINVENPSLSTTRTAINDLLNRKRVGATPAQQTYTVEQVYSREQVKLAVGANYSTPMYDISGKMDFSSDVEKSSYILKFLQVYYTVDMDPYVQASDFFQKMPDVNTFGGISPVYVSSVTYGRMVIFSVTTSASSTEIEAALSAAMDTGIKSGSIQIDAAYAKTLNESKIEGMIIGGSGAKAAKTITGIQSLNNFITTGGNYSADSPGGILSYKLRYINDNSTAKITLASKYKIRDCNQRYYNYKVTLDWIKCHDCEDDGTEAEIWGNFRVEPSNGGKYHFFSREDESGDYVIIEDGGDPYKVNVSKVIKFDSPSIHQDYLNFIGWIFEDEDFSDDHMEGEYRVNLSDIGSSKTVNLHCKGDGQHIEAKFTIKGLAPESN